MHIAIKVSRRGLMTIYFKRRASCCNISRESLETKKTPKSGFFFNGEHKYVTSWVIWIPLFIIYVLHNKGITERPRDYLFLKSGIGMQHLSWKLENEKAPNSCFLFNVVPNCVTNSVIRGHLVIIYALYQKVSLRSLMIIYFKSRAS